MAFSPFHLVKSHSKIWLSPYKASILTNSETLYPFLYFLEAADHIFRASFHHKQVLQMFVQQTTIVLAFPPLMNPSTLGLGLGIHF